MDQKVAERFLKEIDDISEQFRPFYPVPKGMDFSKYQFFISRFNSLIDRTSRGLSHYKDAQRLTASVLGNPGNSSELAFSLFQVVRSIKDEIEMGYLSNIAELVHGEVFADFLDMAGHLREEGYKDAAAVIAGSALESHLRVLCPKWDVRTEYENNSGDLIPKKAARLNDDLAKAEAYSKLDQKSVVAWLDFRNSAAHGHYDKYSDGQVAVMIDGIRDFIVRHPA
jgi:hypothetical protein